MEILCTSILHGEGSSYVTKLEGLTDYLPCPLRTEELQCNLHLLN